VEERVLDVQLVDRPRTRDGDAEDNSNRCRFDSQAKGLVIVDAMLLGEAADDPVCLVAGEGAIGVVLMFENPLAGDDFGTGRTRYEPLGVVVDQRLELFGHGHPPVGICEAAAVVRRDRRDRRGVCGDQVHRLNPAKRPYL
jgi:hypothetical protein